MILLLISCQEPQSNNDYSTEITALEERINQLADAHNEDIISLTNRITEIDNLNTSLQANLEIISTQINILSEQLANNESRLENIENNASTLIVSTYEVDCNSTMLNQTTGNYRCDLVEGIDPNNMPIVQIYNNRTAGWEYFGEWACGYSGSVCQNADQSFDYSTPGMGLRLDDALGLIYTAPYRRNSIDNELTTYSVVIIGSQSYTNPN